MDNDDDDDVDDRVTKDNDTVSMIITRRWLRRCL